MEPRIQPLHADRAEESEWEDDLERSEHDDDDDDDFVLEEPALPLAKLKAKPTKKQPVERIPRKSDAAFGKADGNQPPENSSSSHRPTAKRPKQVASFEQQREGKIQGNGRKKLAAKAVASSESSAGAYMQQVPHKKAAAKKKAPSKDVHAEAIDGLARNDGDLSEIDVANGPDKRTKGYGQMKAEGKSNSAPNRSSTPTAAAGKKLAVKKKKKSASMDTSTREEEEDEGVEFIENPNVIQDGGSAEANSEMVASTPLSQIWTTHVEGAKADSLSGDAQKTLVYQQDFVWDESVFTNNEEPVLEKKHDAANHESIPAARDRPLGKRQMRSVQQAHIRQNLMAGNLDPHTMVQCESYRSRDDAEILNSRSRGSGSLEPPFQVQVHPDAVFVCDLHAHLATCEIIGFLGGRWDETSKTLYIQAAFPCRSLMIDGDDGSTDVEMDPGSEIELREIIQNAQLEVVGWYHSHPAFAPDPSIRDIENQTSYQQLFQRRSEKKSEHEQDTVVEVSEPFVGLIVGTYDTKRDTPVSLFRYFHTRGEKVSGGAIREIYMPYELVPTKRHYRSVLRAEKRTQISKLTMYPSVHKLLGKQDTTIPLPKDGVAIASCSTVPAVEAPSKKVASTQPRKRKLSSEVVAKAEKQSKKGKRGKPARKPRSSAAETNGVDDGGGQIDLTGDDVASAQHMTIVEPEVVPIFEEVASVVGADAAACVSTGSQTDQVAEVSEATDRRGEVQKLMKEVEQKLRSTSFDTSNKRRTRRSSRLPEMKVDTQPVTIDLVDDDDVEEVANVVDNGATEVHSATPPSLIEDNSTNSSGSAGRRRNRKPEKTTRKSTTFQYSLARDDRSPHNAQSGTVATQIAVYDAFGSVVGSTTRDTGAKLVAEKEKVDVHQKVSEPMSDPVLESEVSGGKYVFVEFNAIAKSDDSSTISEVKADSSSSPNLVHSDSDKALNIVGVDELVTESQSQSPPAERDDNVVLPSSNGGSIAVGSESPVVVTIHEINNEKAEGSLTEQANNPDVVTESDFSPLSVAKNEEASVSAATAIFKAKEEEEVSVPNDPDALDVAATSSDPLSLPSNGNDVLSERDASVVVKSEEVDGDVSTRTGGDRVEKLPTSQTTPNVILALEEKIHVVEQESSIDDDVKFAPDDGVAMVIVPESQGEEREEGEGVEQDAPRVLLFGSGRQVEDIRSSLDSIKPLVERMKAEQQAIVRSLVKSVTAVGEGNEEEQDATAKQVAPAEISHPVSADSELNAFERQQAHLQSLRTKYGNGIRGCAEQVITLVDYYRDFERRIDLNEHWKAKVSKLHKIEASLSEYVRYVNLPAHLRQQFVEVRAPPSCECVAVSDLLTDSIVLVLYVLYRI